MAEPTGDQVVLDIDDTAERPVSEHDEESEQEDDLKTQQAADDSIHAFTGHEGLVWK